MANLFEGIFNLIQGFIQSILAIIQSFFNLLYSIVYGVFSAVWSLLESTASLVGASAHFLLSNIVIIGLLGLAYVIYADRQARGRVGGGSSGVGAKKVA